MKIELFGKYKKITADEGIVFTTWVDGDDIINYTSFRTMYIPLNSELENIREITEEQDAMLLKEQEEKIKNLQ